MKLWDFDARTIQSDAEKITGKSYGEKQVTSLI